MKRNLLALAIILLAAFTGNTQIVQVTNTANSGAGSLRQAILDANNDQSIDKIEFNIPTSDAGFDASRGVFTIAVSGSPLPVVNNNVLHIDGFSQTAATGNTNTALLGEAVLVGVDQVAVPQLDGAEIEIIDAGSSFDFGIKVVSEDFIIEGIALYGFGNSHSAVHGDLVLDRGAKNILVSKCSFGTYADQLARPANPTGGYGISAHNADDARIEFSVFAFADNHGLYTTNKSGGCDNWTIEYCQFLENAQRRINLDGIGLERNHNGALVQYNYVKGNKGCGVDFYNCVGNIQVINNTIINNGKANNETAGIRAWGSNNVIEKNIIANNYGAGVMVVPSSSQNKITKNSIYRNGAVSGENGLPNTFQIGIDLLESGLPVKVGEDPFVSLNDMSDADNGGNAVFNHAVVQEAYIKGSDLWIKGYATSGSEIEFFTADNYPNAYRPQGKDFIATLVEGSGDDRKSGSSQYGPGPINGYAQGEDTARVFEFKIPKPSNVNVGDTLTLTATKNHTTSEFSPAFVVGQETAKISPVLECVYPDTNGTFSAVYGYYNPNGSAVTLGVGSDNRFHPAPQGRGQDTLFNPGRKWATFEVPFSSGNIVWILNGKTATASVNSQQCYFDLQIEKYTSKTAATKGDTITFRVEARNRKYRPMTNVVIADTLSNAFSYVSSSSNYGSYDVSASAWSIPAVPKGDTAVLEIVAVVQNPGVNRACFVSADQTDGNAANNCDEVLICIDGDCNTSGGNDGGIESNPNRASLLADHLFETKVKGQNFYENLEEIPVFNREKLKVQRASASLSRFVPQTGPDGASAVVTTPSQLINVTNAEEMLAVDYFKNNQRLGSIIAIRSENGSVYEHTKVICDRLNGAVLNAISQRYINGYPFILAEMTSAYGEQDYAISFVAVKKTNGDLLIDTKWNIEQYGVGPADSVFNFQLWSVAPDQTEELVKEVLAELSTAGNLVYRNVNESSVPKVFVKSGDYNQGVLRLEVANPIGVQELTVFGNVAVVENGERIDFEQTVPVQNGANGDFIEVETNYIFDAGFSLTNEEYDEIDVLYFADGPWGVDYEETGASSYNFATSAHDDTYVGTNELGVERGAHVSGEVQTYFTLYRNFEVGAAPINLSLYNQLEFVATNNGDVSDVDVVLASESIQSWGDQFRKNIVLSSGTQAYKVGIPELTSANANATLSLTDVQSLAFAIQGDQTNWKLFDITLSEVKFTTNYSPASVNEIAGEGFTVFPNPTKETLNVAFGEKNVGVSIQLFDNSGRQILSSKSNGENVLQLDVSMYPTGIYFLQIQGENETRTVKVSVVK